MNMLRHRLLLGLLLLASSLAHAAGVQLFSNNAVTTLAAPATSSATSLTVSSSTLFPSLSGGNWFVATLEHLVSGIVTADEIVKVTAVSGATWTVVRAQEGTSALTWVSGDTVALLPTAGGLVQFQQPAQVQTDAYNYAVDTGSVNAYVVALTPALTAHVVGMPIRFKAAHTNTGTSTFNDGAGAAALTAPAGVLGGGEINAGAIVTSIWDGTEFQLAGTVSDAVVKNPVSGATQTINGPVVVGGSVVSTTGDLEANGSGAILQLWNTPSAPNNGKWIWQATSTAITLCAYLDNDSGANCAISINRSGDAIESMIFGGVYQAGTTQATGDSSTAFATTAFVKNVLSLSPALGGVPTVPTAATDSTTTQISNGAYTVNTINYIFGNSPGLGGVPTTPTAANGTSNTQVASTAFVQNTFTQSEGSITVAYQPSGVSGITTGYTAIIADTTLVPGAVYAMEVDAPLSYGTAASNTLESRVIVTTGSSGIGSVVPTIGGGLNTCVEGPSSGSNDNIWYGNAASMTGGSIFSSTTQQVVLRGTFTMPSTATSVTFEMAVTSGTLNVLAGAYVKFTRVN
jgi:hypothetical protein